MVEGLLNFTLSYKEEEVIEFSGIREFIDDPIRTYSAGMRARLGFAIISSLDPEILLLDEVMSVGDHEFRKKSRIAATFFQISLKFAESPLKFTEPRGLKRLISVRLKFVEMLQKF